MRRSFGYLSAALFALTTAGVLVAAQQHPQKPGKWQVKVEVAVPGMPQAPPPQIMEVCVTEADLNDPQKLVSANMPNSDCKVSDYKIKEKTASWNLACPSQQLTGNGEITYEADTFTGKMTMKVGANEMTAKYSGKWLSTCTK